MYELSRNIFVDLIIVVNIMSLIFLIYFIIKKVNASYLFLLNIAIFNFMHIYWYDSIYTHATKINVYIHNKASNETELLILGLKTGHIISYICTIIIIFELLIMIIVMLKIFKSRIHLDNKKLIIKN